MGLGIILLVLAGILFASDYLVEKTTQGKIDLIKKPWPIYAIAGFGVFLMINPFIYNTAGERTYIQDPIFGTEKVEFEPGIHWAGFFARTKKWPDVMSTEFDSTNIVHVQFNDDSG